MAIASASLVTQAQREELREAGYGIWQDHGTWSWACLFGGAGHGAQGYTSEPEAWLGAAQHFLKRRETLARSAASGRVGVQEGRVGLPVDDSAWPWPVGRKEEA